MKAKYKQLESLLEEIQIRRERIIGLEKLLTDEQEHLALAQENANFSFRNAAFIDLA